VDPLATADRLVLCVACTANWNAVVSTFIERQIPSARHQKSPAAQRMDYLWKSHTLAALAARKSFSLISRWIPQQERCYSLKTYPLPCQVDAHSLSICRPTNRRLQYPDIVVIPLSRASLQIFSRASVTKSLSAVSAIAVVA